MIKPGKLVLQSRWKLVHMEGLPFLLYYGIRNPPHHHDLMRKISQELAGYLQNGDPLSADCAEQEMNRLIQDGILVAPEAVKKSKTPENMQVCSRCVTNDYVVPGLEFNDAGVCALCQCYETNKAPSGSVFTTVSEEKLREAARKNNDSRFDVMLFYTGGKDSSYLLWLLARKLKLRVIAAFWDMPYCSDAAYENIRRAKKRMPEVEFIEWSLPINTVREAMLKKWHSHGWPCLCPTVAFALFYPLAAQLRIPYLFLGIEDVQASVLDYVVVKPGAGPGTPLSDRDKTLGFLSVRSLPRPQKTPLHWPEEMSNYHAAIQNAMPGIFSDLSALVQKARNDDSVYMPLIGRLRKTEAYGSWVDASQIIEREMGWQAPADQESLLHTSCILEPLKDYLQFQRFKSMHTVFMPQSIVELGAAVFFGLVTREEALRSVNELGYWAPPGILGKLTKNLGIGPEDVKASDDQLPTGLWEWVERE